MLSLMALKCHFLVYRFIDGINHTAVLARVITSTDVENWREMPIVV